MLNVNDKIDLSNQENMDKLGNARLAGNWIVMNRKRTIVKFIGNENDAKEFYGDKVKARGGAFLLPSLKTVKITVEEQQEMKRKDQMMRNARGW